MKTVAEGAKKIAQEDKQRAYPSSLEDSTSSTLFSGDQILLNATAFQLNSRRPDSDLFFLAKIILFHFAYFDNSFLPLPASKCISVL